MITDKIKKLFQFIEFLHSNIENFKQYDEVINELYFLSEERTKISPRKNFKDKLKYDEVHTEIKDKFKVIQEFIVTPIRNKAAELNVCSFQDEYSYSWDGVESDIHKLKRNFSNEDLSEIFKHKSKYLEYRIKTKGEAFFSLDFFFSDLDKVLKELFDYFKETEQDEFEAFETKTIQVDTIQEAAILLSEQLNKSNISDNDFIKGEITEYYTPQANDGYFEVTKGIEKRKYTIRKYYDLQLQNWESCIDEQNTKEDKFNAISNAIFGLQKDEYNNSFPEISVQIRKNIQHLENIRTYIEQAERQALPPQQTETETEQETIEAKTEQTGTLSDLITHKSSFEIIESVKIQYRNIKGKRLKLLLMAFQELGLLPNERIAKKFHSCCKNEFDWNVASYNAMNGYNYNDKTDKVELNNIKQYLETLTQPK